MNFDIAGRRLLAVVLLSAALGACSSDGAATSPSRAVPLETVAPGGGLPGKILDSEMIKGSQPPMLRYIVRLDDGRDMTIEEPASRYLGNGALIYVVTRDGKPYLVKR